MKPIEKRPKSKQRMLITNCQRLQNKDVRVIFEYEGDSFVRLYVCFVKANHSPPIRRADLKVFLVDRKNEPLSLVRSFPAFEDNLVESSGISTTAQSIFEYRIAAGQSLFSVTIELSGEATTFALEDAYSVS